MTDVINYLNQYQAQQPNMLDSYDDTQGMPRQRPADPLRWLANAIGQNQDLPAPQFFMDPRALSVRNMLHSGLGTAANWLDGTKDPSLIGPQEMVSPLGLAGMGMGVANAVTRPGRDFRIAEQLTRQHPEASAVGTIPRYAPLRDASNPTSAAHVADYGSVPGARPPMNSNATPYAVMADNAKGSAPGTVINSLDMSEAARMSRAREQGFDTERPLYHGTKADFDAFRPSEKGKFGSGVYFSPDRQFADEWTSGNGRVIEAYGRGKMADDAAWTKARDAEYSADGSRSMFEIENAAAKRLQSEGYAGVSSKARGESVVFDPKDIRSTKAAFDPAKRDSAMLLAADNAKGSAPGTVVNSLDMSEAARMARAKEMGFDTDRVLYHGSQSKFSEFDPSLGHEYGIFLSPNKGYAQPYAGLSERGTRNQPGAYFVRAEKVARPHSTEDLAQSANKHLTKADADRLRAQGIDAIEPKEVPEFVLFDPAKIRSVDAAFDPAKRDSADLLASSPSASAPGLAANSTQPTQQDDQGVMSILRRYGLAD